jgi:hypothetical protein
MANISTEAILKIAQTINPQINAEREFSINLEQLRQLPEGTLGRLTLSIREIWFSEPTMSGMFLLDFLPHKRMN